ncbi:MAG: hypothetical protein AAFZ65_01970 [Planctomycetota bacterium]
MAEATELHRVLIGDSGASLGELEVRLGRYLVLDERRAEGGPRLEQGIARIRARGLEAHLWLGVGHYFLAVIALEEGRPQATSEELDQAMSVLQGCSQASAEWFLRWSHERRVEISGALGGSEAIEAAVTCYFEHLNEDRACFYDSPWGVSLMRAEARAWRSTGDLVRAGALLREAVEGARTHWDSNVGVASMEAEWEQLKTLTQGQ